MHKHAYTGTVIGALYCFILAGTTITPNTVPYTLIVAVVIGTLFLMVLLCCPPIFICCCYKDRKMKKLKRLLHQTQGREPSPLSLEITSQDANLQPPEYEEIQATAAAILLGHLIWQQLPTCSLSVLHTVKSLWTSSPPLPFPLAHPITCHMMTH